MDHFSTCLVFVGIILSGVSCAPTTLSQKEEIASNWFGKYGYGGDVFSSHQSVKVNTLIRFQYFANISLTGQLDQETMQKMQEHRCGIRDPNVTVPFGDLNMVPAAIKMFIKPNALSRVKRYNPQGTTWRKSLLTWRLVNLPAGSDVTRQQIRSTMTTAAATWSKYTNIDFKEIDTETTEPDIVVKFGTYNHGGPFPFDGPGGTLAHAFYPLSNRGLSGDMHLDDDEEFTVDSPEGINLAWVMTHELGHSLGLDHSPVQRAVMYPWYQKYRPGGVDLEYDDMVGIQSLYGGKIVTDPPPTKKAPTTAKPTTTTTTTTTTTKPPTTKQTTQPTTTTTQKTTTREFVEERKCPVPPIQAIYNLPRIGHSIFLAGGGKSLYFFHKNGIQYGPMQKSSYFPKARLPGKIDAAFTMFTAKDSHITVLFSGPTYYIFRLFGFKSGPHGFHASSQSNPLNFQFPDYVQKVDAAMRWHRNQKVYIFAGNSFWKYDDVLKQFFPSYPKNTQSVWKGAPSKIDAAYSSSDEKRSFFLSGDQFYLLNDMLVRVAPGFPQHIGVGWLNCGDRRKQDYVPPRFRH